MKVLIAETPTTHIMVTNMNNGHTTFVPIEDWDSMRPMFSDNSVYEEVHITRNLEVLRMEELRDEVNRTATV